MNKKALVRKKGFGILEVLLAGVIIITMLGALVILAKTVLGNTVNAIQRTKAMYFAQEGVEAVRQIRDTNYIDQDNTTKWNSFIRDNITKAPKVPADFAPSQEFYLKYDDTSGSKPMLRPLNNETYAQVWTVDGFENNIFVRKITFADVTGIRPAGLSADLNSNSIVKVICTVTWGGGKSISVEEFIADSRPNF